MQGCVCRVCVQGCVCRGVCAGYLHDVCSLYESTYVQRTTLHRPQYVYTTPERANTDTSLLGGISH